VNDDRRFSRAARTAGGFATRRGPAVAPPLVADTSWRQGLPAIADEHRGSLADAEADVAYRFAAAAAEGRDVLDVGCGAGHGAGLLLAAGARSVVGVDPDDRAVEIATRLYGERGRFVVAEPAAMSFAAASFGLITCFDALEEATDPLSLLTALRRLLAPGGLLFASLPLEPLRDRADGSPLTEPHADGHWEREAGALFENVASYRRRVCLGSSIVPASGGAPGTEGDGGERGAIDSVGWLGSEPSEDRSVLLVCSDGDLPELDPAATLVGGRDLRAYRETVEAWEYRARRAEADGAAKHWELVASREAQRRLRKRLWHLEHRPLRKLFRVLRGRPARLGEGPPIRPPEREQDAWN
jgi:SAM-dependent methyltransferase